jgi:hypothetical protein
VEVVEWIDSGLHIDKGWESLDVYRSVAKAWSGKVTTVGFPIFEDSQVVVLALSKDEDNDYYFGAQLIAKKSITFRKEVV